MTEDMRALGYKPGKLGFSGERRSDMEKKFSDIAANRFSFTIFEGLFSPDLNELQWKDLHKR